MLRCFWRLAFRLLYNELALSYDLVSRGVSLGRWRDWQRSLIPFLPAADAGTVLELAHGTGDLHIDLLRAGYQCVGLDLSPQMGALAQRKLSRAGLMGALLRGDVRHLPFADESLAAIVCTFPAAFILQRETLAELQRALQPGAGVFIVMSGALAGHGLARMLIRGLYWLSGQDNQPMHTSDLRAYFDESGFLAQARTVQLADSAAQLVILTKPNKLILDSAGNS